MLTDDQDGFRHAGRPHRIVSDCGGTGENEIGVLEPDSRAPGLPSRDHPDRGRPRVVPPPVHTAHPPGPAS
ncbi:hypothetical protein [Streptomyces sp. NRRL F-4474]|uniref:hypothetical protein n=1 Tax=Streptomyces sp. NRRL F-4474 TaxID=1463851 RepID=UPI0004CAB7BF|nr:hypothetical protein [Streptomyces sp. NRRL F-4474]